MSKNVGDSVQVFTTSVLFASEHDVYLFQTTDSISARVTAVSDDGSFSIEGFDGQGKTVNVDGVVVGKPEVDSFYVLS